MIEEQNNTIENEPEKGNEYQEYIDTINELKRNSVPKEKYEQLEQEKKGLIDALKSGGQVQVAPEEEEETIEQLRHELYDNPDKPMTNLEYIEKTLKLRDKVIKDGGRDPFLPNGADYHETQEDIDKANYIAQVYQECIDYAEGDSQLFTNELMRRTANDSPLKNAKK